MDKPRGLSMRLTPNHWTIVHKVVGRHHRMSAPFVIQADDLRAGHYIPRSAEWLDPDHGTKGIGRDLAALCGWVAAEGWYGTVHSVYLSQSATANPGHVAGIDAVLQRLAGSWDGPVHTRNAGLINGRWRAQVQADGVIRRQDFKTEDEARAAVTEWRRDFGLDATRRTERQRAYSRSSRSYSPRSYVEVTWSLSPRLSAEMRRLMPDKRLPWELANLPSDEARALLEAFIAGDGHTRADGRIAIFQSRDSKVTVDVLQAIAVRLGYKTNISLSGGRWVLYLTTGGRPLTLRGTNGTNPPVGREHYRGIVWCPTTGTGTFIARRNGSVFVTGNSFPCTLIRPIILGWSPPAICTACGQGRRPVTVAEVDRQGRTTNGPQSIARRFESPGRDVRAVRQTTITGYACSCPQPGAPTRPSVVLDPFSGTGTTSLVAAAYGRIGIGVDRSHDYSRLAKWRVNDPGERARALKVPTPPKQVDGQGDLFSQLEETA